MLEAIVHVCAHMSQGTMFISILMGCVTISGPMFTLYPRVPGCIWMLPSFLEGSVCRARASHSVLSARAVFRGPWKTPPLVFIIKVYPVMFP